MQASKSILPEETVAKLRGMTVSQMRQWLRCSTCDLMLCRLPCPSAERERREANAIHLKGEIHTEKPEEIYEYGVKVYRGGQGNGKG